MPAAPKDDGLSKRTGQPVTLTNNGTALSANFLPPHSEHWATDTGTANYDVIPVEYHGSELAQYRAPFLASNEQSYLVQGGETLDASIFTSNTIAAGVVAPDPLLGSFHSLATDHPGFYSNTTVDPSQQQDDSLSDLSKTHLDNEDYTTSLSFSKHLQVTQDDHGATATGLQPSLALSAAGKGSQWPAPALLRSSVKRKGESKSSSAVRDSTAHPIGLARQIEHTEFNERMSYPTPLPGTTGHSTVDTGSRDQLPTKATNSISSDPANGSGANVEATRSGGGLISIAAQPAEPNVGPNQPPGILQARRTQPAQHPQSGLPAEKVFPIQIGSELFRLSGASIASDGQYSTCMTTVMQLWENRAENSRAPSYFSQFFEDQLRQQNEDGAVGVRTLYIDRDPVTFQDISRHLQGYHVQPRDGGHFVRLFADAQFYSLPRLISQLFDSEIFIQIGHQHFQVPRDIFSGPGDSPNYFSLGFTMFFSTPAEVFPGLDRKSLLRPPSILPPSVPNHSAEVFSELLHMLRGYPLHIRNEEHRAELLQDCRYYHLRGLEQKLIPHNISYNLERGKSEIIIRLEDIRQSGVSFSAEASPADRSPLGGWVKYARPFVDEDAYELILEVGGEATKINLRTMRADFRGLAKARISSLFQVVANKMNLPTNVPLGLMMLSGGAASQPASPGNTPLSEDQVKIRIERDAHVILDGSPYEVNWAGFGVGRETNDADTALLVSQAPSDHEPTASGTATIGSVTRRSAGESVRQQPASQNVTQQVSMTPTRSSPPRKRRRLGDLDDFGEWIIRRGQWRLQVQASSKPGKSDLEMVLVGVKLDAISGEHGRNMQRAFLS